MCRGPIIADIVSNPDLMQPLAEDSDSEVGELPNEVSFNTSTWPLSAPYDGRFYLCRMCKNSQFWHWNKDYQFTIAGRVRHLNTNDHYGVFRFPHI